MSADTQRVSRRDFLKLMATAGIVVALTPLVNNGIFVPGASAQKYNFKGNVIIIGAGAAGLYAGYTLKMANVDFLILEASATLGGRLRKNETFAKFPIDLGGQWIHGERSLTKELADRNKVVTTRETDRTRVWFKNRFMYDFPQEFLEFESLLESDYGSLPDISFKEFALQQGYGQIMNLIEWIANEAGTSASRLSVRERIRNESKWTAGETNYVIRETYFDIINDHVASFVRDKVVYNAAVKKIDYSKNIVEVMDRKGNTYTANKVIITVPIAVLKDGDIEFVPALPEEKIRAFKSIGMDSGMKVFLKFKRKFYRGDTIGGIKSTEYLDAAYGKRRTGEFVLVSLIMGEKAEHLSSLGKDAVKELLAELDLMFRKKASPSFVDAYIQDWEKEPFIRGAYSYETVGMGNAREIGAEPVDGKLYFAGEALNTGGHSATVHGACETGYNQVLRILSGT